jgi:ketosteroid isomerase-like protein
MTESSVAKVAEEAFAQLTEGLMKGKWEAFFNLFADEVDLILPYPPSSGHYTGAEGREKLIAFFKPLGVEGNRVTEVVSSVKIFAKDRVIFEDHSRGELGGQPFEGFDCIHIVVADGKVVGFHEYFAPPA